MSTHNITIDLNKPCKRCGKKGTSNGGLCLRCILKALEAGEFDHILKSHETSTKMSTRVKP
jgi:hypothetical protein